MAVGISGGGHEMAEFLMKEGFFHTPEKPGEKPYLLGSRCGECGYVCFPKMEVCVKCLRDDTMEGIKLGERATLETYTVMRVGTPDFPPPYIIGYVRTKEGVLVFTPITGCEATDDALQIGEEMELVIEKIKEDEKGNLLIGWKYKPVKRKDS
jgi:uncharacterized OB-fold protein